MKTNQTTIKVYDTTRETLRDLSDRYGISMCAIVDVLAKQIRDDPRFVLNIPPKDPRSKKSNIRHILHRKGP